jgi:archaellum component FlaC
MSMSKTDDDNTDHYEGALLEDIRDQIKRLTEALAEVPQDVRQLKEDVGEVKQDVKVVKAVVSNQSSDLDNHEKRLKRLEKVTA